MKDPQENKTHKITFRLKEQEAKFLDDFAGSVGVSRSDTLRNLIRKIQRDASIIKTDKLLNILSDLAAEQGRVNNNINQLARHANQYSKVSDLDPKVFVRFNTLLTQYLDFQEDMNRTFRKIYRSIS